MTDTTVTISSADLQKKFGAVKRQALNTDVMVHIHGKPTLALISYDRYVELKTARPEE